MNERRMLEWLLVLLIVALVINFIAMFWILWRH